jgi:hypothetical protein
MALDEDEIRSVLQEMLNAGALPPARITASELRVKTRRRDHPRIDAKAFVAVAAVVALLVVLFTAGPLKSSRQFAAQASSAGRVDGYEYVEAVIQVRVSGQITVRRIGSKNSFTVRALNGQFSFSAKPGNYLLTGNAGDAPCSSVIVTVLSGRTTNAPPIKCEGM